MSRFGVISGAAITALGCFIGAFYVEREWAGTVLIVLGIALPVRAALYLEGHRFWPSWIRRVARRVA